MSDLGSIVWFVGLGAGIVIFGLAIAFAAQRRRRVGGDPNAAWKEAARESGHRSVAEPPPS